MGESAMVNFEIKACITCGVLFAITTQHEQRLRKSHATFYCPNGHSHWYPGETDEVKIRRLESTVETCKTRCENKSKAIGKLENQVRSYKMLYAREKKKNKE